MKSYKFLEGSNLYLRSVIQEDYSTAMLSWYNDKEVTFFLSRGTYPANEIELKNDFLKLSNQKDEVVFAICDKNDKYIGIVGLHGINTISRHAEFRILIGEKDYWGKGYGAEACQLIVAYGFHMLNLQKVWLGVNSDNTKAYQSYLKCGFIHEGTLRREIFRSGSYHDIHRMSILKEEYRGLIEKWRIKELVQKQLGQLS